MKRYLLRLPNWIGDSVMATPALETLREFEPESEWVIVGTRPVVDLFGNDPNCLATYIDPSRRGFFRTRRLLQFGQYLKREHGPFDAAFLFPFSISARVFGLASGARERVGLRRGLRDWMLTRALPSPSAERSGARASSQGEGTEGGTNTAGKHVVEMFHAIVSGYFESKESPGPLRLHLPDEDDDRVILPMSRRPLVGIHVGAAQGNARRWPLDRFASVARELASEFDIVILGGPQEVEASESLADDLERSGVSNFEVRVGTWSVTDMAMFMRRIHILVTADSGPMHLATALKIPTVAVFGPSDPVRTSPWRHERSIVVRNPVECSPCHRSTCPLKHHACMTGVAVKQVLAAVARIHRETETVSSNSRVGLSSPLPTMEPTGTVHAASVLSATSLITNVPT